MPDEKKKAPRKLVGPTAVVFAIRDLEGYHVKAGALFEIEQRFVNSAIAAGVIRAATTEEKASFRLPSAPAKDGK